MFFCMDLLNILLIFLVHLPMNRFLLHQLRHRSNLNFKLAILLIKRSLSNISLSIGKRLLLFTPILVIKLLPLFFIDSFFSSFFGPVALGGEDINFNNTPVINLKIHLRHLPLYQFLVNLRFQLW